MRVRVSPEEVAAFNATWPCSKLPECPITFEFDERGDLVDMDPFTIDGPEAVALAEDAQERRIGTEL
jgi:hypothetical protein